MKKILGIITALFLLAFCSGCELFTTDYPVEIGNTTIKKQPESVVVLSENTAFAVEAMGYSDKIIGAPSEYLLNKTDSKITDVGSSMLIDYEKVKSLKPDVIIAPEDLGTDFTDEFKKAGADFAVIKTPDTFYDLLNCYIDISKLFNGKKSKSQQKAEEYYNSVTTTLNDLNTKNNGISKKLLVFPEYGFVVTGDTFAGQALKKAGIPNLADAGKNYMMSYDEILKADPEIIFCPKGKGEEFIKNYSELTAAKNGCVYEINMPALLYGGSGFTETLTEISNYIGK